MNWKNYWMTKMNKEFLVPIVINSCIDFLKKRPINTTYHPNKGEYILDGRTVAKIMRHDGNLRAKIDPKETVFFTNILKYGLDNTIVVESMNDDNIYKIDEFSKFGRFSVKITNVRKPRKLLGTKPKVIEGVEYVPVGYD
jgi:hypothetical protein